MNGLSVCAGARANNRQPQLLHHDCIRAKPRMSSERKLLPGFRHVRSGTCATISR